MLDVETVFDAPQALQQLENRKFALAIIDLMMTPMTGIELIATIRKSERTPHLAIIATSGIGDERAVLEAKAAGADAFMLKPFSTTALRSKVATLMSAQLV
jgi:CheY-like chemotaxis protein